MKIFLITEACFHTSYLIKKIAERVPDFWSNKKHYSYILRNKTDLDCDKLTTVHNELKGKTELTQEELSRLKEAYKGLLSEAEQAMIKMYGVPDLHVLSFLPSYLTNDLNSSQTFSWLENEAKTNSLSAIIFLDCILKPLWLAIFENRIVNAHSAILPYARGMYSIEQTAALTNQERFTQAAGSSIHYIDEKVDIGQLISTRQLTNVWNYNDIWEIKAASYLTAFELLANYLTQDNKFSLKDGTAYNQPLGPVYRAKDMTVEVKEKAVQGYITMKSQSILLNPLSTISQITYLVSQQNIDININELGYNALHAATGMTIDVREKFQLLIKLGVDVNRQNFRSIYGNTPLHILIVNEEPQTAIFFINCCLKYQPNQLNLDVPDFEGKTALIIAAKTRCASVALHLLELFDKKQIQLNIDAQDNAGRTALHYAVMLGLPAAVQTLLYKNANTTIADKYGKLAKDYLEINEEIISETLLSVSIKPTRDEFALSDYIYDNNKQPLCLLRSLEILRIPANKNNFGLVKSAISLGLYDSSSYIKDGKLIPMTKETQEFIINSFHKMSGRSLLKVIVETVENEIAPLLNPSFTICSPC